MRTPRYLCAALGLVVGLAGGCRLFPGREAVHGHSPLRPACSSPDSVAMEIIWARFPAGDAELNDKAWHDIDETQIPPDVRLELTNNGFRAGVIRGTLPDAMARALHQGEPGPEAAGSEPDQTAQLLNEPAVRRRLLQLRRGRRAEIQASEVYPSLPLLLGQGRELGGGTYADAQAIYALQIDPQPNHTVHVQLTPELHYGPARLRWTRGDEGVLHQAPLRDRKVFDQLRMSVALSPGEMLVLMSLPDAGSRLGHYFHTVEAAEGPQQKLILLRLAQVPPSDTFADLPAAN